MGMFEILWEVGQTKKVVDAAHDANEAQRKVKDAGSRIADLEHAIDKLMLINRALWEIIQKYHPVDNEYLTAKINEIDLRDGKLDGKLVKKSLRHCQSCGKTLSNKHPQCIYCGSEDLKGDPFDKVK